MPRSAKGPVALAMPFWRALPIAVTIALCVMSAPLLAHDVADGDKAFVKGVTGPAIVPFFYLGAKHMVTGYDHVLFLIGVVFYLRRFRDVAIYVSMFTVGHSTTLLAGVLMGWGANAYLIDAIIGLSVAYKGLENTGALKRAGWRFDPRLAVLIFGLFHGMGLATKVIDLELPRNGLLTNLIAFNVGVEAGQMLVLVFVVALFGFWRARRSFARSAYFVNILLVLAGLALCAVQIWAWAASTGGTI